jgi:hypothetical protein
VLFSRAEASPKGETPAEIGGGSGGGGGGGGELSMVSL